MWVDMTLATKYFIGKLLANSMGFFVVHFSLLKSLYQMVGKVIALAHCPLARFLKFNVCYFDSAAIGGLQQFFICLCRIGDVVQSFLYRRSPQYNSKQQKTAWPSS